jgi:ABC-2 type transport system permease protein/oleandomycin transport system permease protein
MTTTAALVLPERPRLTLLETLHDSRVMAARQVRKTLRRPTYIVFSFVQPVIFVLLFRYVFGGAIHTGSVSYVNFLMPGIFVQTAVFGALVTGMGLTEDMKAGVVDRFRSLPIARSAVLLGRTAADMSMNIMTLVVMVLVGLAVGFRPSQPVWDLALAFVTVLAFSYSFSWISAFVGLSVRDPETAQSAGFIWVFPLTFASFRSLTIGHAPSLTSGLETAAWLLGLLIVFVPLSVRAFRQA